jgi:hypothetical protein
VELTPQEISANRTKYLKWVLFYFTLVGISFLASYFLSRYVQPELAMKIYPPSKRLFDYCSQTPCIYDTSFVSLTYAFHFAICIFLQIIILFFAVTRKVKFRFLAFIVGLSSALVFFYFLPEFGFEENASMRTANNIHHFKSSIIYYLFLGTAINCVSSLALFQVPDVARNAKNNVE